MKIRISMVHHNPGEEPFLTKFSNPDVLSEYSYNGQAFKHINTVISFDALGHNLFPKGSQERKWLDNFGDSIKRENLAAKRAGLDVFHHIDLFVLPKKLVELYNNEICDENGKISIDKEKTLELHKVLFDEMFLKFPELDGLIIRVGETYLHDTPYHTGNGAVIYGDVSNEKRQFIKLINFLRQEICVKHNKKLIFRTWDCFNDRFHANPQYYIDVTEKIEPHDNLYFSIKHTALDFWRRVKWNECLCIGKHKQIVEVQCQREYEGKGAYPSYVMNNIINGDKSNKKMVGLKDIVNHPLISGIYTWPRGGGWAGPYSPDEFWSDLNTYVISHYAANPQKSEEEIFKQFAFERLNLSKTDAEKFRTLCLTADDALLKGRYIECYDASLGESECPCCNWMRDDVLGGLYHSLNAFEYLFENNKLYEALSEKEESYRLWQKVYEICLSIDWSRSDKKDFIITSCEYAVKLFAVVYHGWSVITHGYMAAKKCENKTELAIAINNFDYAWNEYQKLSKNKNSASLYKLNFVIWNQPGLKETIDSYRELLSNI